MDEKISCGYVNHRILAKSIRKTRWGVLVSKKFAFGGECCITLYKEGKTNCSNNREAKLKHIFNFTHKTFRGIDKGEHYDKHGMKRYLLIIDDNDHFIVEDAVVTKDGLNHNVLNSWFSIISDCMSYVNKWQVDLSTNYLHVSKYYISECLSLEQKFKVYPSKLAIKSWKVNQLANIEENVEQKGAKSFTTIKFIDNKTKVIVKITLKGFPNLKRSLNLCFSSKLKENFIKSIDELNYKPNLVKLKKKPTEKLKTKSEVLNTEENLYVNLKTMPINTEIQKNKLDVFKLKKPLVVNLQDPDDNKNKNDSVTNLTLYDSDYLTGESFSTVHGLKNQNQSTNFDSEVILEIKSADVEAPPLPQKDSSCSNRNTLESEKKNENPTYENCYSFDLAIEDVLRNASEHSARRWLNLPYSVMVRIFLELERDGITTPNWKNFAEFLGLNFSDIQKLVALMRTKHSLQPMCVLLTHWNTTQDPLQFNVKNFKKILSEIGRPDLAKIIPDYNDKTN